ncbi:MAG: ethanolamine utilization microcompartment protein EutL [Propionibacteriaceae bacterium]|jgi:ethanolamine utilization protein EutL|nr:ethanolamine utilization microcompartment protein EutL [Propionibacteriaceae bacterium]
MIGDPLKAAVLSMKIIPNVDPGLAKEFEIPEGHHSLGLFTCDSDDVGYTALDEATKKADVRVVYAKSMYAGAANANTKLAGELIGVISGPNPAEVRAGLNSIVEMIENEAWFLSANDDDSICYYAYTISRTGSYLSEAIGQPEGTPIAYLIAPPEEAIYGLDAALKAAEVEVGVFYGPPSETNFGGALLYGEQSACKAACNAFADAVNFVAAHPTEY